MLEYLKYGSFPFSTAKCQSDIVTRAANACIAGRMNNRTAERFSVRHFRFCPFRSFFLWLNIDISRCSPGFIDRDASHLPDVWLTIFISPPGVVCTFRCVCNEHSHFAHENAGKIKLPETFVSSWKPANLPSLHKFEKSFWEKISLLENSIAYVHDLKGNYALLIHLSYPISLHFLPQPEFL